jgi:hypothetical protein
MDENNHHLFGERGGQGQETGIVLRVRIEYIHPFKISGINSPHLDEWLSGT